MWVWLVTAPYSSMALGCDTCEWSACMRLWCVLGGCGGGGVGGCQVKSFRSGMDAGNDMLGISLCIQAAAAISYQHKCSVHIKI